jgi:hypothetical protein
MDIFLENNIKKYFDFLFSEHNFSAPIFYNIAYEEHIAYIKDDFFINIAFDGSYWVTIDKYSQTLQEVLSGKTKINDLDYRKLRSYYLSQLDPKKELYNSIQNLTGHEKDLYYYVRLLKDNPEVLNGNFKKFSLWNTLLRKI